MLINRIELIKALEEVRPGLASKEIVEQSTSFTFKDNKVITYNHEMSISHPVNNLNISGAIKAEELYNILKKIKDENVKIEKNKNEILITANKLKTGLTIQSEIKIPLKEIEKEKDWKSLPSNFLDGLKFCKLSCGKNISSSVLSYININKNGTIESSNGFKVASYTILKNISKDSILISISVINELVNYNIKKYCIAHNWIHFKTKENTIFSCRMYGETFPNISDVINFKGNKIYISKELIEVLDKAQIFSKSPLSDEEVVEFFITDSKIKIYAKTEIGWFEETVKTKQINKFNISFKINPKYLKMAIETANELFFIYKKNKIKFSSDNWTLVLPIAKIK